MTVTVASEDHRQKENYLLEELQYSQHHVRATLCDTNKILGGLELPQDMHPKLQSQTKSQSRPEPTPSHGLIASYRNLQIF